VWNLAWSEFHIQLGEFGTDGPPLSSEAGWTRETDQASQRNCQTSRACHPTVAGRSEIDTRAWLAYGFAQGSS
jgi:hypothetical protein